MIYDAIQSGKQKITKKVKAECNELCSKSIENAKFVADTIYKSDDKFDYIKAVMNMELQAASRYTKMFCSSVEE